MLKFPFEYVLLDADETIFDFKKAEKLAVLSTAESFSLRLSENDTEVYSQINMSFWKLLELGKVTRDKLKVLRFEKLFEHLGTSDINPQEFAKIYEDNLSENGILYDGALEFVRKLSEVSKVYIVTNGLKKCQHGRMDSSPIREFISGIFISEEIGYTKPDKRFFDAIFDTLGICDKSKVIIIGDSLSSDMQGGRNAGITTCRYSVSEQYEVNPLCDYTFSDYNEFFYIFQ